MIRFENFVYFGRGFGERFSLHTEVEAVEAFQAYERSFMSGMTAKKYSSISGTPPATTTRDLAGRVEMGALIR